MDKAFVTDFSLGDGAQNLFGNQFTPSDGDAPLDFPEELNTPAPVNPMLLQQQQQQQQQQLQQQQAYQQQFNPMLYGNQFQMNPQLFMNQMTPQQRQFFQQQQYMMMQQRLAMQQQAQAAQSAAMMHAANASTASAPPTPAPPTAATPPPTAPTGTWQSPNDNPSRREVITRIIHFLQSQKPNAPPDWMRRLPQMAKKLEESLYRNATSKAEYMDTATLKQRLQVVARSFHTIKQQTQGAPATPQSQAQPPSQSQSQPPAPSQAQPPAPSPSQSQPPSQPPTPAVLMQTFRARVAQIAALMAAPTVAQYNQRVQQMMGALEQYRPMLVKQFQRLLLLRHATWCHTADCPVADCAEMKALWAHLPTCGQASQCGVAHCISSKYLLSHFQQCALGPCVICQIVRVPMEAKDAAGQLIADPALALQHLRQLQQQAKLEAHKSETLKRTASQMSLDPTPMQSLLGTAPTAAATPQPGMPPAATNMPPPAAQSTPSSMTMQQGMMAQPGLMPQASMMPQPGMMPQAGMMPQPGMMAPPGMMPPPGMMGQAGMMPQASMMGQPGMMPQASMMTQPGMMPQAGMLGQPGVPPQQQQQLLQQKQQIELLKKKFAEWSLEQLQVHSKKLEQLAESLRAHMQKSASDAAKQMELFHSTTDPAARARHQHAAMEAQRQLQDFKAKYARCLTQFKIIAFTIKSHQAPAEPRPPPATTTVATPPEASPSPEPVKTEPVAAKKLKVEPKAEGDEPLAEAAAPSTYMLPQMTDAEIRAHVASLQSQHCASLTVAQLKKKLEPLLRGMMDHKFGWVFSSPVDPVALNIPNYFEIIRRPMDFGTIKKKLDANVYKHLAPFAADVRLTFRNAMTYNNEESDVHQLAKDMLNDFNAEMAKVEKEVAADEAAARARDGACKLCGMESMVFEPAVLYCNGECNSRIRRNCYFFCAPDNKYHCCTQCYPALPEAIATSDGAQLAKDALVRKKNDEVHEEPWVQCDHCNEWVHQVCALFHHKPTTDSDKATPSAAFHCPECLLQLRTTSPKAFPVEKKLLSAKHLPRSKLSDFLERRVQHLLAKELEEEAKWGRPSGESPDKLVIRQVSNIEKQLIVRDKMYARYKAQAYPSEHRFKSKCLCMFQETHGVSVLLFGMYVHEFDEAEGAANARRVYVSYLDSVNYLEPVHLRTKVYHEILIGYLEFVKQRGFHTAHIWACPPLKGDDYILYCHPEAQKTPKSDRLRQWYIQMLLKAKDEGIVVDIHNMYDEYWSHAGATPTALPYFEGDYWVGLAEELIEKMDEEEKAVKATAKPAKQTKLSKPNKRHGRDKDKADAEAIEFTDPLMAKLGEVIKPMKEDFLVVKLFPCCKLCRKMVGAGTVWKEAAPAPKATPAAVCDGCYQAQRTAGTPLAADAWVATSLPLVLKDKCVDPDEVVESEVFDTRQAFLSLCQANHYQFDDLRRAKHTSMMTLYHVGQPPNGYVYSCNQCAADITSGTRWHCGTCPDFDVCEACHAQKTQVHPHVLEPIGTVNDTLRKAREERAKSIALHMQLLVHASSCSAEKGNCTSLNCEKMKELLRHGASCKRRATGGCTICRRVWALLQIHARQCRGADCAVPRCKDLREHLRKLALQQQLMDDRRRAAVTEQYRQLNTTEPAEGTS
ncbi:histone acetyltransferase [Achlya hypogyna]|uniref:histone acetyltransferase n=1 Tax=Achlya hypogyna TaxID=1202772 RepID=A0A1V9ZK32_ACHHY|nr:histone acetyltransferase [Achlya hypogyna]